MAKRGGGICWMCANRLQVAAMEIRNRKWKIENEK